MLSTETKVLLEEWVRCFKGWKRFVEVYKRLHEDIAEKGVKAISDKREQDMLLRLLSQPEITKENLWFYVKFIQAQTLEEQNRKELKAFQKKCIRQKFFRFKNV